MSIAMDPRVLASDKTYPTPGQPNKCLYCDHAVGDLHGTGCYELSSRPKVERMPGFLYSLDPEERLDPIQRTASRLPDWLDSHPWWAGAIAGALLVLCVWLASEVRL